MKPTKDQFESFEYIFEHFNSGLFKGCLPQVILTFSRGKRFHGFFAPDRWKSNGKEFHEIALNPETMNRPKDLVCSTLVHEQVHLWQQVYGIKKPKRAYHNKEWAKKMKDVGLYPSNTGHEGGKEVGANMTHYIIPDGPFIKCYKTLDPKSFLPFEAIVRLESKVAKKKKNKVKYCCPGCQLNVWGGKDLLLRCNECEIDLIQEETKEEDI